ncbi:MAG: GNAT family N-acetyltransferase [Bradymonadaceae bacterium]|nr:GNAT family N-acetyltransferase [Lujinxingiaceae bacterium]
MSDVEAVGRLFYEDMRDLGVDAKLDELEQVARDVIASTHREPRECLCIVARLEPGADAVGVILANFNWSLKFAGRSLWIEELFVTHEARRHSIGRMLVEELLNYADENGIKGIDLEAYQGNTPASILYRSLGFHRLGRERFYYRMGPREYL